MGLRTPMAALLLAGTGFAGCFDAGDWIPDTLPEARDLDEIVGINATNLMSFTQSTVTPP